MRRGSRRQVWRLLFQFTCGLIRILYPVRGGRAGHVQRLGGCLFDKPEPMEAITWGWCRSNAKAAGDVCPDVATLIPLPRGEPFFLSRLTKLYARFLTTACHWRAGQIIAGCIFFFFPFCSFLHLFPNASGHLNIDSLPTYTDIYGDLASYNAQLLGMRHQCKKQPPPPFFVALLEWASTDHSKCLSCIDKTQRICSSCRGGYCTIHNDGCTKDRCDCE